MSHAVCYRCLTPISATEKYHGLHAHCFIEWFQIPSLLDFREIARKQSGSAGKSAQSSSFTIIASSFFQGTYKKYAATLHNKHYILKVEEPDHPELPATEYLCNQIARLLGFNIPDFFFIRFENELNTFVVKNFMQDIDQGNLIHIYHYIQNRGDFSCQNLLEIIKEKTGRLKYMVDFIKICLFDALIGNHDRHGRNLGMIETHKGFMLAPMYDNPGYLAIEHPSLLAIHHEPRGTIATSNTDGPTMKDYVSEFRRLGYETVVADFQKSIKLDEIDLCIENSFIEEKRKIAFKKLIARRYDEMSL
jgi:hypothetical protein